MSYPISPSPDFLLYPSARILVPRCPSLVAPRRLIRLQASPSSLLSRSPWTGLRRNSSSCRRSITGACPAASREWSVAQGRSPRLPGAPHLPFYWRRRLYLVLASRRWRVESQLRPVIHVTPFSVSSRAASFLLSPPPPIVSLLPVCCCSRESFFVYLGVAWEPSIFALHLFILQQAELKHWFHRCLSSGVRVHGSKAMLKSLFAMLGNWVVWSKVH